MEAAEASLPMSDHFALQPAVLDAGDQRLSALETQLAAREQELSALKRHLLELQTRYFEELGPLYTRLYELEDALTAIEIRLGLRPPADLKRTKRMTPVRLAVVRRGVRTRPRRRPT